jgi:putative phosphoesterase
MLIGVISDTHGKLDEEAVNLLKGSDRIIHAGDIGNEEILWELEKIAPVIAVRGNNDSPDICVPVERLAIVESTTLFVVHEFAEAEKLSPAHRALIEQKMLDVVVFGHSHKAYTGRWRGTLLFNPGSAGPKRFTLPRSIGFLRSSSEGIEPEIVYLPDAPRWISLQ